MMPMGPIIFTAAISALFSAVGLKMACRFMFGTAPSYGNAWLAAFAGAVASAFLSPMIAGAFHGHSGYFGFGIIAFLVQAAVFKAVLYLPGRGKLSFGESCIASLLAVFILMVLSMLFKGLLGFSLLAGGHVLI
ncbi:hypothetical protein SAMN06275492_14116 [Dethiosulfovibrio salsuginis]|uniref:Uncharacterized protein n=2 Tax=Dethiosulfovibrio salsuginis TaxID=561720 RepID=A0A1X7KZV3_9BACT|nr:hypothetical protein SAMN06275492_14116 [Dethiosulfovibrio salsuginis]